MAGEAEISTSSVLAVTDTWPGQGEEGSSASVKPNWLLSSPEPL